MLFLCSAAWGDDAVNHRFFKAGWASGGPAIYDEAFHIEWSLDNRAELSDGWLLGDGGLVLSYSLRGREAGIVRLGPDKQELWKYTARDRHDNHSCQPLPHGGFLAGETAKDGMWMVEIDRHGKEMKRIKVGDATRDMFHTFRQVRKTPQGTYLAAVMCENKTYEWDESGKLVRTFPYGAYVAIRLPNGNTLVTAGHVADDHGAVVEYDKNARVVWELTKADIERLGIRLSMVCGAQRLPNGNTVITNVDHGASFGSGDMVKAFEVTPGKKMVWQIPSGVSKGNMGVLQILDVPGDVCNFGVLR
jgi:hypothetical protein